MAGMVMDGYCSSIEVQLQLHTQHFFCNRKTSLYCGDNTGHWLASGEACVFIA
jgi:hypothetical protein